MTRSRPSRSSAGLKTRIRSASTTCTQGGFTLAALMIMIMVMSIVLAVAMPSWSNYVQREKEAEAIFRGLQYAEAIRVFQVRHGRPPTTLEELVKVEPRSIRQLYPNPLNESGSWGLLIQQGAQATTAPAQGGNAAGRPAGGPVRASSIGAPSRGRAGGNQNQRGQAGGGAARRRPGAVVAVPPAKEGEGNRSGGRLTLGSQKKQTTGPLVGVYPAAEGTPLRTFNGASSYDQWRFQADLILLPVIAGGESAAPRVTSEWIGKPFRSDLNVQPKQGQVGGAQGNQRGRNLTGGDAKNFRPGNRGNQGSRGSFGSRDRQGRGSSTRGRNGGR